MNYHEVLSWLKHRYHTETSLTISILNTLIAFDTTKTMPNIENGMYTVKQFSTGDLTRYATAFDNFLVYIRAG